MTSKQLSPAWNKKHKDYMKRAMKATINVAEGSVRAGKTVDQVAVFAKRLVNSPDRIHLATGSTAANAKLNIGDCNGYGLEYLFRGRCHWTKYKGNEALAINVKNRQYIVIFAGASKSDSYKKIRGNSYGMWIATEINLHHPESIREAFNRQLAAKERVVFWDLNPCSPASPIYKDHIDRFAEQYGERYNYEHFTIRDNINISEERFRDIEKQYDPGSIWYRRDILGERCSAEGIIYDMFNAETHVINAPATAGRYYVSSDFGIQNATTFLLWQQTIDGNAWVCVKEYFYSGRENRKQKTVGELCDDLETMLDGIKPHKIIVDPSATALKVELRKRKYNVINADNDVVPGISDVATMLRQGKLLFTPGCVNTIGEFGIYCWDEKAVEQGEDKPLKENDHAMDAVRYFVRTLGLAKKKPVDNADKGYLMFM